MHVYRDGLAYEVEFTTLDGKTAAVVTLEAAQVLPSASAKSPTPANSLPGEHHILAGHDDEEKGRNL